MQYACAILPSVACPVLLIFFPILSHKGHEFREKKFEHKICLLVFSTNSSEIFLSLRRNERDMVKNVYWSSWEVNFILVQF